MRRQLAFVLAAWMGLLQPVGTLEAYAARPQIAAEAVRTEDEKPDERIPVASPPNGQTQEKPKKEEVRPATSGNAEKPASPGNSEQDKKIGTVVVEVRTILPLTFQPEIRVEVKEKQSLLQRILGEDTAIETVSISLLEEEEGEGGLGRVIKDVEEGKWELTVTADGYLPYRQTLEVKAGTTHKIMLLNDYDHRYDYTSDVHPGLLRMGDVNGDDTIDKDDLEALVDAVWEGDVPAEEEAGMDLNRDEVIDLLDLQYFSSFYTGKKGEDNAYPKSMVERIVSIQEVPVATSGNASIFGSVENLFNHTGEQSVTVVSREDAPISETNPVELSFEFEDEPVNAAGLVIQSPSGSDGAIRRGHIEVELADGTSEEVEITEAGSVRVVKTEVSESRAELQPDGSIVVTLKGQVPVKKVTIRVTGTVSEGSLAEISQVEFLGDMKDRIPPPVQNIPKGLKADIRSAEFTLSWDKEVNVSGYEVAVSKDGKTEVLATEENSVIINNFDNKKLLNYETYGVKVRSVNGSWKSKYSGELAVTPEPDGPPDPPENISVQGGYRSLDVSWKKMKDTKSYSLYYRQKGTEEYLAERDIQGTNVTLTNLEDHAEYELYMIGHNPLGDSRPSKLYSGKTVSSRPARMPAYGLINREKEEGAIATEHILEVENVTGFHTSGPEDVADGDPNTFWWLEDWDSGANYSFRGPIVTLDQPYKMDTIRFIAGPMQAHGFNSIRVRVWDKKDGIDQVISGRLSRMASLDGNGSYYYEFTANEPFTAQKIQINLSSDGNQRYLSIGEIRFYEYDSLLHEIDGLFADDLHISLKPEVTPDHVKTLKSRAETVDETSQEYHPKKELALKELNVAESILATGVKQEAIQIDTTVSKAYDRHITFSGGLNAWQPLGVAALTGETVTIYVGSPGKTQGDKTSLKLFATQYHGESSHFQKDMGYLQIGINEVTIPQVSSLNYEQGGALYVEYTGNNPKDSYAVRVSGGSHYPVLDVTKAKDEAERNERIKAYYEEMKAYVETLEVLHNEESHRSSSGQEYDEKNCILGATDIVLDQMMYSVAIKPLYQELQRNGEPVKQLTDSLAAMDSMIRLYYQHKGLSDDPTIDGVTYGKDKMPTSRLNIRYQRMFAGAFMYAGGLHIGIEWDSVPALGGSAPVEHENGRYQSGQYFGWGISHEIGHIINEGAYAYAEVTNNYYPQLAQSRDSNDTMRFDYEDVYKKVTSGTKGGGSERLAMYWQLHMAYDNGGFNFKTYDNYRDQRENLIFARIDSYARDTSRAPAPKGIKLTLANSDKDNSLMRLACAAAEKNLLEFFIRWGLTPNEETVRYASQFEKETRAIYYENDDSRVYRLEGGRSVADTVTVTARAEKPADNSNQVVLTMKAEGSGAEEGMLGYEITRIERRYGKEERRVVGFTTENTFTDTIMTVNNRVAGYEVRGIDKCMNATETFRLEEEFKISHDGAIDKSGWKITINTSSEADQPVGSEEEMDSSCSAAISSAGLMIDNQADTVYEGTTRESQAMAVISLGKVETIAGIKYTYHGENPIRNYKICISDDGEMWTDVKTGTFSLENGTAVVYFDRKDDPRYHVYDTAYVRIIATGSKTFNAAEFDILAPVGDNIELDQIGKLSEDAVFGHSGEGQTVIPQGSVVFQGTYKGNPAYNMMIVYDETGNVVGGMTKDGELHASMLIFAPAPVNGQLGEITEGTWIYYIEPEAAGEMTLPKKVRAELYRTEDAQTNGGDRLVSDTLLKEVPETLPDITIQTEEMEAIN